MSEVVVLETHVVVEEAPPQQVVVEVEEGPVIVVTEMEQGPPGPGGALLIANRLAEFSADPAAQADAQANIGLGVVDPLAYYILAKA